MRASILLSLLSAVLAAPSALRDEPAPLLMPRDGEEAVIPGQYIVKLKDSSDMSALDATVSMIPDRPSHIYSSLFQGFSVKMDKKTLKKLRNYQHVEYIEHDATVTADTLVREPDSTWGLGKISHRNVGSKKYIYDSTAGAGTCVYVLDTGVEASHPEFEGRAKQIKTFISGDNTDGNGHGTHVSGTIGSKTWGVAKKTKIFGVKVLDDSGSGAYSGVIAALDFVAKDKAKRSCPKGVMVNMSLGGPKSDAVNAAAASLVSENVFVAVAAGNSYDDAANYSPASEPTVCTVGAISRGPQFAYYSNWGSLVDVLAPGTNIKSTWIGGSTNTISGTSMATPHITGLAAYFGGLTGFPGSEAMCEHIASLGTAGLVRNIPSETVDKLAFNGNRIGAALGASVGLDVRETEEE